MNRDRNRATSADASAVSRRRFIAGAGAAATFSVLTPWIRICRAGVKEQGASMDYKRADFAPLRKSGYGAGFHWTTATMPAQGDPVPYEEAVADFDVPAFVDQAVEMGVGHVLFTSTHIKHHVCGPNPEVDRILPGRTCERDLLMDLANGLAQADIKLMLYYNSGIHSGDPEWRKAVGHERDDPSSFFDNWCRIIGWMGKHYGPKVAALWVDGGWELDSLANTPWADLTAAAKAGHPQRLVSYSPGIEKHTLFTPYQDYWAGELCRLNFIPRGDLTPSGLPWHAFVSWHGDSRNRIIGYWVMSAANRALDWQPPSPESAAGFLRGFQRVGGAVTFNLFCYQDGSVYPPDLETMKGLKSLVRG